MPMYVVTISAKISGSLKVKAQPAHPHLSCGGRGLGAPVPVSEARPGREIRKTIDN